MLFTRVRREGQGQRERRELSEGGRWALTQDAVGNGIPAPDPQVEGSAELLAIRMTLKTHLTPLRPTSLPSGLQRGPPRGDRSAPVNSLAEKDTNGGTERRGARQGNWTRPSTGRWRRAPDGGGTAPGRLLPAHAPPPSTGGRAALRLGRNTQPARSPQTTARQDGDPGVTIPNPALCKHRTEDAVRVTQRLGRSRSDSPSHRDGQRAVGRRRPGPTALTGLLSLSLNEFKRRSL